MDPDLILGHEVINSCLEPLVNKCKEKGIDINFLSKFP